MCFYTQNSKLITANTNLHFFYWRKNLENVRRNCFCLMAQKVPSRCGFCWQVGKHRHVQTCEKRHSIPYPHQFSNRCVYKANCCVQRRQIQLFLSHTQPLSRCVNTINSKEGNEKFNFAFSDLILIFDSKRCAYIVLAVERVFAVLIA